MRILYLHQFFMTRAGIGGTRSYEFARRFVQQGHEVTMVTAGDGSRRVEDGIQVVSVPAGFGDYVRATKLGYGRRAVEFARFAAAATRTVLRLPRPDVIYATSPPLTMALPALAASKRFRTPLVFEVRDLWPEAPIQMGALPNPALQRVARLLEHTVYRGSAHVNALSPGMRDGVIAAGVAPERVSMIPNASDLDMFDPQLDGSDMRERLGLGDGFVCSYFGTMGEANDLNQVIDAAPLAPEVTFVLHGDGKRREALVERARGVENVVFSEPIPDKTLGGPAGGGLRRVHDDLQGRSDPGHLLAEQAVRHVRGGPARGGELRRLDAVAGRGQRRGRVRAARRSGRPGRPGDVAPGPHRGDGAQRAGAGRAGVRPRPARRPHARGARARGVVGVKLSYCIVNTNGAEYLPACLEAVARGP